MSKKISETKTEKQAKKTQPTELKNEELEKAQGGIGALRTIATAQAISRE